MTTSYDRHQRTFPGMYNSHYMDAYAAFDPEKSDWNKLNPKSNRVGYVPGSSLRDKPQFIVAGLPADEHARNTVNLTPANMSSKGWMPTEVMPVWDSKQQRWDRGLPKKYDFVTSTFGSQFAINHPDSPDDRYVRASEKIGEASSRRSYGSRHGSAPPGKQVSLTTLGDWNTTISDRPMTSDDGYYRTVTNMRTTGRPASAASVYSNYAYKSRVAQTKEKTFLSKSLQAVPGLNITPSTWAGIATEDMVDPRASANDRTRFCRGADNIKQGVMTRPEKFSRYKTTAWRTNKAVEDVLKTNKPRKKGDPYNPDHVFGDKTKVSGDSPGWFGVEHVTVAGKTQGQEKMLTQWGSMRDDPHWLTTAAIGDLAARTTGLTIRSTTATRSPTGGMQTARAYVNRPSTYLQETQYSYSPKASKPHGTLYRGTTPSVVSAGHRRKAAPSFVYKHHYTADERRSARTKGLTQDQVMKHATGNALYLSSATGRDNAARADIRRRTGGRFRSDQFRP